MMLKGKFQKSISAVVVAASLLTGSIYSAGALALTAEERLERQNAKTKIPQPRIGKKVTQAFELFGQEQVDEALALLLEVEAKKGYDKAFLDKFIGNLFATVDGKTDEAIKYLLMSYEPDVLNYKEQAEVINLLAQLYMMKKDYAKAIEKYEEWMAFTGEENSKIYVRIASGYYEMKKLDKIIEPADKAIALATAAGEEKSVTPYSLKLASYYDRKKIKDAVKVAEIIVKEFPEEPKNWVQLGMFYAMVEDYGRGLSTLDMAYKQGFLEKPHEFRTLAQMFSHNGVPIKAATIQEKYIKLGVMERTEQNLKNLGNYFLAAKEMIKAAKYFGEAAKVGNKPYLYRRQGEMLFSAEKYAQAIGALKTALDKDVENKSSVTLTLMQSYFYNGDYQLAYNTLMEANKYPKARGQVRAWRQYIIDKAKRNGVNVKT